MGPINIKNNNPFFIAEISSNHNSDLKRMYKLIDTAKNCGFDAVKFQLFKINKLFSYEILKKSKKHNKRKKWELDTKYIPKLKNYCKKKKILFGITPFYLEAINESKDFVDFYKVASYELNWLNLIEECSKTRKYLILSTGMAKLKEVKNAVKIPQKFKIPFSVLHCVSIYPTKENLCNLKSIEFLRKKLKINNVGWSDHTVNEKVILRACHKWDAKIIEMHIDLDGKGYEYKSKHCWLPKRAKKLISLIKNSEVIDGKDFKKPVKEELKERLWRADPQDGLRPYKSIRKKF